MDNIISWAILMMFVLFFITFVVWANIMDNGVGDTLLIQLYMNHISKEAKHIVNSKIQQTAWVILHEKCVNDDWIPSLSYIIRSGVYEMVIWLKSKSGKRYFVHLWGERGNTNIYQQLDNGVILSLRSGANIVNINEIMAGEKLWAA